MSRVNICKYCQNHAEFLFSAPDYNRRISGEEFNYYHCRSCGLIFLSHIPENLAHFYGNSYYEIPENLRQLSDQSIVERYKLELIQNEVSSGRLLEIGSANGNFAYLAKQANYDVTCIEMDANCCTFLNQVVEVTAINSDDPERAINSLGEFDIIALWHVIEHIPEPWALLKSVAEHVSKTGIVVIATPNPQAIQFRIFQRRWTHLDAPRHLQLIPLSVLQSVMSALAMGNNSYTTNDRGGLGWNTFGWRKSFANYSQGLFGELLSVIGKGISLLMSPIERLNLNGSTHTVIFRK